MAHLFRTKAPQRTCNKKRASYHNYKDDLAKDFNNKCGYTNCADHWFGGKRCFQIDHFKPESKYPQLKNEYSNLIYCCSYVNRAKWDDESTHYLDPCDVDYNQHFERDDCGIICAKAGDADAEYMVEKMNLNPARYSIMWNLERLENSIDRLKPLVKANNNIEPILCKLLSLYYDTVKSLRLNQ